MIDLILASPILRASSIFCSALAVALLDEIPSIEARSPPDVLRFCGLSGVAELLASRTGVHFPCGRSHSITDQGDGRHNLLIIKGRHIDHPGEC